MRLSILLPVMLLGAAVSFAQTIPQYAQITYSVPFKDAAGNTMASGSITFAPFADAHGTPVYPSLTGGGGIIPRAVKFNIVAGSITPLVGTAQLVDVTQSNPTNFCYQATIHDNQSGQSWTPWSCVQPAWNATQWCAYTSGTPGVTSCDLAKYVAPNQPATAQTYLSGLTWRGAWSSIVTYTVNDAVSYNGASYVSTSANNLNNAPPGTGWALLAAEGASAITGLSGDGAGDASLTGNFTAGGTVAANEIAVGGSCEMKPTCDGGTVDNSLALNSNLTLCQSVEISSCPAGSSGNPYFKTQVLVGPAFSNQSLLFDAGIYDFTMTAGTLADIFTGNAPLLIVNDGVSIKGQDKGVSTLQFLGSTEPVGIETVPPDCYVRSGIAGYGYAGCLDTMSDVTIENLTIDGGYGQPGVSCPATDTSGDGIQAGLVQGGGSVSHNEVRHWCFQGISIFGGSNGATVYPTSRLNVVDNDVWDFGEYGIGLEGHTRYSNVAENHVHNPRGTATGGFMASLVPNIAAGQGYGILSTTSSNGSAVPPSVTITTGTNGAIASCAIPTGDNGTANVVSDQLTLLNAGGSGGYCTVASIANGGVVSSALVNPGTGARTGEVCTSTDGTNIKFQIGNINASTGAVQTYTLINVGSGGTTGTHGTTCSAAGTGITFSYTVGNGLALTATVGSPGTNYSNGVVTASGGTSGINAQLSLQTFDGWLTGANVVMGSVYNCTSESISGGVATVQCVNSLTAGQVVQLAGSTNFTFLNGAQVQVLASGLSGTQFKFNVSGHNGLSATEATTATLIIGGSTWTQNESVNFTQSGANAQLTACGVVGGVLVQVCPVLGANNDHNVFHDNSFTGGGVGTGLIFQDGAQNNSAIHNEFDNWANCMQALGTFLVAPTAAGDLRVQNNDCTNATDTGSGAMRFSGASDTVPLVGLIYTGNTVDHVAGAGFFGGFLSAPIITDNHFRYFGLKGATRREGIFIDHATSPRMAGNGFTGFLGGPAININSANVTNAVVDGNLCPPAQCNVTDSGVTTSLNAGGPNPTTQSSTVVGNANGISLWPGKSTIECWLSGNSSNANPFSILCNDNNGLDPNLNTPSVALANHVFDAYGPGGGGAMNGEMVPLPTTIGPENYIAGGGTAQAQTATLYPAITSAQLVAGFRISWLPLAANTAADPTLAVNGLTAAIVKKCGTSALLANDLTTTAIASAVYDGTYFELQNPQGRGCASGSVNSSGNGYMVSGGHMNAMGLNYSATAAYGTANRVYCVQFTMPMTMTFDKVGINVTSGAAGYANVGFYSAAGNLLVDSGAMNTTTTAVVTATPSSTTLISGTQYYYCWAVSSTTAQFVALSEVSAAVGTLLDANSANIIGFATNTVSGSGTSGQALPSSFGGFTISPVSTSWVPLAANWAQ